MIIVVCIRSLSLEGSYEGLKFLFKPDFNKITAQTVLLALGQAAFSLSIGMGALITYGSYIRKDTPLIKVSTDVALADTTIAVLSGVMIFPLFLLLENPCSRPDLFLLLCPNF
jgi:NSS family neurotransmitter:Na+ symporter